MVCGQLDDLRHAAAVLGTIFYVSSHPSNWPRAVRKGFARQIMTLGIEPMMFICATAVFVGISVVVQLAFWTHKAGQSQLLGPLLVAVVARELGPFLTNVVVIVRSSSAMATELAVLRISGGVEELEERGLDPFVTVVMPRVLGLALATFCLTSLFIVVALASGFVFGAWLGTGSRDMSSFINGVMAALHPLDAISILAKSILPALFTGVSCCIGGLGVGESFKNIPQVTQQALTRSVAGLFVISAVVSLLTYL